MKKIMNADSMDIELFNNLVRGDQDAYENLFHSYYRELIAYCKQFVNMADAEEVVQDLWLYIWKNKDSIQIHTTFRGYLFISCRNRCLTLIRNHSLKESKFHQLSTLAEFSQDDPDFYFEKELRQIINDAIERLPEKYRESFKMNRFDQLTYNEIAQILGVSQKTVDYRIQMSLKILRKDLVQYWPLLLVLYPQIINA